MRYLIIGAGLFGKSLATRLVELGAEVLLVDKEESALEPVKDLVTEVAIADTGRKDILAELLKKPVDTAIICFGQDFGTTMLNAIYLLELGCEQIWARAANILQAEILRKIGVKRVILPEVVTAERLAESIILGEIEKITLDPETVIVRLRIPPAFVGKEVTEIQFSKYGVQCLYVHRFYSTGLSKLIPLSENPVLENNDNLILIGQPKRILKISRAT